MLVSPNFQELFYVKPTPWLAYPHDREVFNIREKRSIQIKRNVKTNLQFVLQYKFVQFAISSELLS